MKPIARSTHGIMIARAVAGGYVYEAETLAWESAIIAASATVSGGTKLAVDTFVKGAKSDGFWTYIKDCGVLAGNSLAAARIKIKIGTGTTATMGNPQSAADGTNYTEALGFRPEASCSLDSGYLLSHITSDGQDMHLALYSKDGWNNRPMGVFRNSALTRHYLPHDDLAGNGWTWGDGGPNGDPDGTVGFRLAQQRPAEDAFLYLNGSVIDSYTTDGSQPSDWSVTIGAAHGSDDGTAGSPEGYSGYSDYAIQFYSIGTSMDDTAVSNFYTRVLALQTSIGRA